MKTKTINKIYKFNDMAYTSIREIVEEQAEIGGVELQEHINEHYQATDVLDFTPTDTAKTFKEMVINDIIDSLEIQEVEYSFINCGDLEIEVLELAKDMKVVEEE